MKCFLLCLGVLFCNSLCAGSFLSPEEISSLQRKIAEEPPKWMMTQIREDLRPFEESGITTPMLDATFFDLPGGPRSSPLARLQLVNGKVYHFSESGRRPGALSTRKLGEVLECLSKVVDLPNVDFIFWAKDGVKGYRSMYHVSEDGRSYQKIASKDLAPLFGWTKTSLEDRIVLLPDYASFLLDRHLGGRYRWRTVIKETLEGSNKNPWHTKVKKAYWRGSTTQGAYNLSNWRDKPRAKVALLTKEHPQLVDAYFTPKGLVQITRKACEQIKHLGLVKNHANIEEHLKFRYQISLDGNVFTFPGFAWRLLSNSLVFKQTSNNMLWFSKALVAHEHYIPFRYDTSNLISKIQWAIDHDEIAEQIANNGTQFAKENLMKDDIYLYTYLLLHEYANLQKFNLLKPTAW